MLFDAGANLQNMKNSLGVSMASQLLEKWCIASFARIPDPGEHGVLEVREMEVSILPFSSLFTKPLWRGSGWKSCPD